MATAAATWAVSWSNTKIGMVTQNAHSVQKIRRGKTEADSTLVVVTVPAASHASDCCNALLATAAHRPKSEWVSIIIAIEDERRPPDVHGWYTTFPLGPRRCRFRA